MAGQLRPDPRPGLRLLAAGDTAILVELGEGDAGAADVLGLHAALARTRPRAVLDLVPAERTLLVRFDRRSIAAADVARWISETSPHTGSGTAVDEVVLHVRYDGADLDDVGRLTGLGSDGVVEAHTGRPWTVAFTGFAPGFGYLVNGDPRLRVPRRDSPRVRVPAGSVALAAGYSGVYPRPSPGGWQLIGATDAVLWDVTADPPALLRPGVRVRFRSVG